MFVLLGVVLGWVSLHLCFLRFLCFFFLLSRFLLHCCLQIGRGNGRVLQVLVVAYGACFRPNLRGCICHCSHENKFFVTFPYPYMNGTIHLGHTFTISKVFNAYMHFLHSFILRDCWDLVFRRPRWGQESVWAATVYEAIGFILPLSCRVCVCVHLCV